MNKILVIGILSILIVVSGCVGTTPTTDQETQGIIAQYILKARSQASNQTETTEKTDTSPEPAPVPDEIPTSSNDQPQTGTEISSTPEAENLPPNNVPPFIANSSITPIQPLLGESFSLTITGQDDVGVRQLVWETENLFSNQPLTNTFECTGEITCTNSWEFITTQEGLNTIRVFVIDSSGQSSEKIPYDVNVGPYPTQTSTPSQDTISPLSQDLTSPVEEDECNSNSDCGYKEICSSGTCIDVDCTSDSQCSGCRRCSGNNCVSCGRGPYGCYC